MKKIALIILAVVTACFCLVGCGGGDYAGKWELQEMSAGGVTMKGDIMGVPVAVMFQFEFRSDGTGTLKTNGESKDDKGEFKWEEKDGGVVVTATDGSIGENGEKELKFTKEGDLLVFSMTESGQESTMKLVKVDEFTKYDGPTAND